MLKLIIIMMMMDRLFEMDNLIELDLSHNSLQWLSRDIANLR